MSNTQTSYQIRCLHVEAGRPSEDAGEFHWRCRALFDFDSQQEPWQRDFCPYHRHLYHPSHQVITHEEVKALNAKLSRWHERLAMPDVRLDADGLSAEERSWAQERKRELKNQSIAAGVLDREPGLEG